jgi:hypothetical protein
MKVDNNIVDEILEKSGASNRDEAIKDFSLLIALSKRDHYKLEC